MRDRFRELNMLQETLQILEQGYYVKNGKKIQLKLSRKEMEEIRVYLPDDVRKCGSHKDFNPPYVLGRCGYGCENKDSFSLARELVSHTYLFDKDIPKILVLNLANPVNPGGGVRRGAKAQEEDLCRCSSLLLSLESMTARKYYDYNESLHTYMGSDALMITPQVEIIRDASGELLDDTVIVSVVTCAAPLVSYGKEGMTDSQYEQMMYDRITGMLKCVAYLGYKNLVLGAWGCGAFGNDAAVISDLFYKALKEIDYNGHGQKDLFRRIDFAVLDRTRDQYNFKEFCRNFTHENFYRDEKQAAIDRAMKRIRETEINLDKIRGCFVGGAAGDALGYAIEFSGEDAIFSKYGKTGITEYEIDKLAGKAVISDDTQMTLFTANGLLVGDTRGCMRGIQGWPRGYVADAYQDWLKTQEMSFEDSRKETRRPMRGSVSWLLDVPELYKRRAPGTTCLSALKYGEPSGNDFIKERLNDSKGCGGVMRVAPLALNYNWPDIDKLDMEGAQIAAITHGHSLGYMPAAVLTHIINRIVFSEKDMTLREIVAEAEKSIEDIFKGDKHLKELTNLIDLAIELSENDDSDLNNIHKLGEGWVAEETLAISIYCALRHQDDFSAGIIAAVNHKGDSDSTGAVTGNILGALLGYDAIEDKWKTDLELLDVILEMADDICHGCQMSEYSDYDDPDWGRKYIHMKWKEKYHTEDKTAKLMAVSADECQIIDEKLGVQAVVLATDEKLQHGEFPAGQIIQAGGPDQLKALNSLGGCTVGEAKVIKGFGCFDSRFIICTVDPRWVGKKSDKTDLLADCYRACLKTAADNGIKSIAFPSIATVYKDNTEESIPLEEAVKVAVRAVKEFDSRNPGSIDVVKWILYDDKTLKAYKDEIERWNVSEFVQSPEFYTLNKMLRDGLVFDETVDIDTDENGKDNMSSIEIRKIGITDLDTDCIVNAANKQLAEGSGVCGAIFRAAGARKLQAACDKIGYCPTGKAVITPGFALKAKYVIHAVGPVWHDGNYHEPQDLYSCYRESLDRAKENDCHSIGFPLISAGIFGYPKDKAWRKALQACSDWIENNPDYDMNIIFAVLDDRIMELGQKTMKDLGISGNEEDDGKFVFFWKLHHKNEEFSNWYPKDFVIEGIKYNCVEQYMMAKKAILFGDITVYQQIMNETDPGKCKDLGKLVRNFDSATWDGCKREIVFNANCAKFTQNPDLMEKLKATGDAIMAEASPGDKIWGIGMTADDPNARNPEHWNGQNLLGDILMEIRDQMGGAID